MATTVAPPPNRTVILEIYMDHKNLPEIEHSTLSILASQMGKREFVPIENSTLKFSDWQPMDSAIVNLKVPQDYNGGYTLKFNFETQKKFEKTNPVTKRRQTYRMLTVVEECLYIKPEELENEMLTYSVKALYNKQKEKHELHALEGEITFLDNSASESI